MWYECLEKNFFLKSLYNYMPELDNVSINEIQLTKDGDEVRIIFDMPRFVDVIPEKWNNRGYNTLSIEVDFWNIHSMKIEYSNFPMSGSIKMKKEDKNIMVNIYGDIKCKFIAEDAIVQKVKPYIV